MAKKQLESKKSTPKKSRSALMQVIKNKNKIEKKARDKRMSKIRDMRSETIYNAKLMKELEKVDSYLDSDGVEYVDIEVDDKDFSMFTKAINRDELAVYNIVQSIDNPKEFRISRQEIYL